MLFRFLVRLLRLKAPWGNSLPETLGVLINDQNLQL